MHENIPEIALEWYRAGRGAVLATVVETWGSAPRRAGSQLVVSASGEMMGSVSGGCVEAAVIVEAAEALSAAESRLLSFGVSDDDAFAVGLACGGTIRVLLEPVGDVFPESLLAALVAERAARRATALLVDLRTFERRLAGPDDPTHGPMIKARLRADRAGLEGDWFAGIHNPPLRLLIVGAVHIAQPLVAMARHLGYDPILVDPRKSFAQAVRFPGEEVSDLWPDEALEQMRPDARTAVVTLTHDPKLDDPAIAAALRTEAFYIGCLGSVRTHARRVERLGAAGFGPEDIARLHAPVGLAIGAATPAEIGVSILAEITAMLRQGER